MGRLVRFIALVVLAGVGGLSAAVVRFAPQDPADQVALATPCSFLSRAELTPPADVGSPPPEGVYDPLRGDDPELNLGLGRLYAVDHYEPGWVSSIALPLFDRPQGSVSAWLANGWIVPTAGPRRPFGWTGAIETGYETVSFLVLEERDGWLRFRFGRAAADVAWTPACALDLASLRLVVERWDVRLMSPEISPLYFRVPGPHVLRRNPNDAAEQVRTVAEDSRAYVLRPSEIRGDWMRVEMTSPSDMCGDPETPPVRTEAWVRWRDAAHGPLVWYYTRGC